MRQVCCIVLVILSAGCASSRDKTTATPSSEFEHAASMSATVESVDLDKREITLAGPDGATETFGVTENVRRLNEIKAGDTVNVDYYVSLATELRAPTAEEQAAPLVILDAGGRAAGSMPPGGLAARRIRAVVLVEAVDASAKTLTVKGPLGGRAVIHPLKPENLEKVKAGDTLVITYTEAVAISVEETK